MGLRKGYVYPDENLICPECSRTFKNIQSLTQHRRKHLAEAGGDVTKEKDSEIARLQEEVKVLRLQNEKRHLESFSAPAPPPSDIMYSVGAGAIEGEAKAIAQRRVLGLTDTPPPPQQTAESWLSKLINQPGGIETVAKAVKGILGIPEGGNDVLNILKELGINLREIFHRSQAPPAGALKIAGLDLSGMPMTPEVLAAILDYEGKKEAATREAEGRAAMAGSLNRMMDAFSPLIAERLNRGGITGKSSGTTPSRYPRTLICSVCKSPVQIPADIKPGEKVSCSCGEEYVVGHASEEKTASSVVGDTDVEVEPETMRCVKCGQSLDITGLPLLTEVKCPVCNTVTQVTDPDTPLPAKPVTQQEKAQTLYQKNQGGLI